MTSYYRYAQEFGGQRLHLVEEYAREEVSTRAICGRNCYKRGNWRMTINMPLAALCKTAAVYGGVAMTDSEKLQMANPGSDEALKQGCLCAVLDNRHGLGAFDHPDVNGKPVFWVTESCPLHGGS